jgi:hypothetical protein
MTTGQKPPQPQDQVLRLVSPTLGCDPELFLTQKGKVIGAEKVIPELGLSAPYSKVVLDGIQVELNPMASTCRQSLAYGLGQAFLALHTQLAKMDKIEASFHQIVEVDQSELDSLSDKAKLLGCAPSLNAYDATATIGVDPNTYKKRSAGGHIHLGLTSYTNLMKHRERLVPLLDILVGNTSVLIDRDPGNAERRQVYGRAGEHRLPAHGLEYRTLSNFWLRGYPLMSGMFGLARLACDVLANTLSVNAAGRSHYIEAEPDLLAAVDLEAIRRAIDTNDLALAKENWKPVRDYLYKHTQHYGSGIYGGNLNAFDHFIEVIDEKGLNAWFPKDPMVAWCAERMTSVGWENFLSTKVRFRAKKGTVA